MHFHLIMMKHARSESPTALSKPPAEGDEKGEESCTSSESEGHITSPSHFAKADANSATTGLRQRGSTATTASPTSTKTKSSSRWSSLLPESRRRRRESILSSTVVKKESFHLMDTLGLFWKTNPKEWIRLALYLFKRHFYWPLLQNIRSRRLLHLQDVTEKEVNFLKSHMAHLAYVVIVSLAVAFPGSFYILFHVALCVLFGQMVWIALQWILYIYDDPAVHRAVVFYKGWLQLVLHQGRSAIQNPDAATVIMAAATIQSAPTGISFFRYALRYKVHYLHTLWMDDLSTRERYFGQAPSLQKLQDKFFNNSMMQPPINFVRSIAQESNSIKNRPGRLEV